MESVEEIIFRSKERLLNHDSIEMREQIVDTATSVGSLQSWIKAFQDDADMVVRLKSAFK